MEANGDFLTHETWDEVRNLLMDLTPTSNDPTFLPKKSHHWYITIETTSTRNFDPSMYGVIFHLIQNKTTTFLYPPKEKQPTKSRMYPAFLSASSWLVLMAFITTVEPAENQQTTNIKLFLNMQTKSTKNNKLTFSSPINQKQTTSTEENTRGHHTFSDHTDQHLWYQGQWPTKGLHLRCPKAQTGLLRSWSFFFVNTFTFLVKNHMDTNIKCMWISCKIQVCANYNYTNIIIYNIYIYIYGYISNLYLSPSPTWWRYAATISFIPNPKHFKNKSFTQDDCWTLRSKLANTTFVTLTTSKIFPTHGFSLWGSHVRSFLSPTKSSPKKPKLKFNPSEVWDASPVGTCNVGSVDLEQKNSTISLSINLFNKISQPGNVACVFGLFVDSLFVDEKTTPYFSVVPICFLFLRYYFRN